MKRLREKGGQQANGRGAQEQRSDAHAAGKKQRDHQTGQHGVRDGVAHQAHPPQHEETADERAGDVRHRADQNDALRDGRGERFPPVELSQNENHRQ